MNPISEIKRMFFIFKNSHTNKLLYNLLGILVLFTSLSSYLVCKIYLNSAYDELIAEIETLDKHLAIVYTEHSLLANLIGYKIANGNYQNDKWVADILQKLNTAKDIKILDSISWPSLTWSNSDGIMIANRHHGVLASKNKNLNLRSYVKNGRVVHWTLHISHPDFSILDNQFIIPAGMGVTNSHGDLVGFISFGFDVDKLISVLTTISLQSIKFTIYDEQGCVYATSDKTRVQQYGMLKNFIVPDSKSHGIIKMLREGDNVYLYHKHLSSMPGLISVGYDKHTFYMKVLFDIIVIISIFFTVGIICLFLMLYTTSMLVHTTSISVNAKKTFTMEISNHFADTTLLMLKHCNHIANTITNVRTSTKTYVSNTTENIANAIKSLYLLSTYNITLSPYNLNDLVRDAIQIKYNEILAKGGTIKTILAPNLPKIFVDSLSIKQAVTSIISYAIDDNLSPTNITILTYSKNIDSSEVEVYLEFQNILINVTKRDISNLINLPHSTHNKQKVYNYTNLSMLQVQNLIEHNKGNVIVDVYNNIIKIKFIVSNHHINNNDI